MSRSKRNRRKKRRTPVLAGAAATHAGSGVAEATGREIAVEPPVEAAIVQHPPLLHGEPDPDPDTQLPLGLPIPSQPLATAAPPRPAGVAPISAPPATAFRRADSLDALRGLFLILMTIGFTIQGGIFPDWMYHRQFPPPGDFAPIAGIAWRDLAYAAFLFTMAAALPITTSRRIDKGETELGIFFAALRRGFLLFVFALLIGHSNTYFTGYTQEARALAVAGFAIMALIFTRRRTDWSEDRFRVMRYVGWGAAVLFLALSPLLYDETFSPERRDQVIASLAFAVVAGTVVWYFTRNNLTARLAVLGATVALYLGAHSEGWLQQWWWSSPAPWLVQPSYLSLLMVVIPGTIAGDLVLRWMRTPDSESRGEAWSSGRVALVAALCIAFTPLVVIGLYNRWVAETTQIALAMGAVGLILVRNPQRPGERLLNQLFVWSAAWLLIGLVLDPAEDGIRKVPETMSYWFTVSGLTMLTLAALVGLVDLLGRRRFARPMIEVGQNPMVCYVLFTILLNSVFEMIPALRPVLRGSPAESLLRSALTVIAVVALVQLLTRRRIFWRT